jgi:hypothetical protein
MSTIKVGIATKRLATSMLLLSNPPVKSLARESACLTIARRAIEHYFLIVNVGDGHNAFQILRAN